MRALNKKAIKDITRRKLRAILTVLGIAVGVMGLTAINIASNQINDSLHYSIDASAQPDVEFFTTPTNPSPVLKAFQHQPNVKLVAAQDYVPTRWKIPSGRYPLNITGLTNFTNVQFNTFELVSGQLPGPNQIVLEDSDRTVANLQVGSQIDVEVRGAVQKLTVSGFVRTRGLPSATILDAAYGYMHESDLQALFQSSGANDFLVRLNNYNQRNETAKQLAQVLQAQHVVILDASVGHSDGNDGTIVNGLLSIMQVLSIIALLLSIFLLLSTITTLITEQVQVIGTMKAIGARRGQVMRNYLTSVAIYGVIGTIVGLGLGILLGYLLVNLFASLLTLDIGPLEISPSLVLLGAVIGIGVPLLAAALPIYLGTRITVHQALSGYGLDGGAGRRSSGWARGIGRVFAFFPQTIQLGTRSLFRKRTRAMLTLIALMISGAAFLCVQTTTYSFNSLLNQVFSTYHADVFVGFPNPQPYRKVNQVLASVPGVAASEPGFQEQVQTQWGNSTLTGVEPDAHLYQKDLVAGRWFTANDQNAVVLSTDAASKSGLKIGDTIAFHTALYSARWEIIGMAVDHNNPIGLGVMLATVSEVQAFEHLPSDFTQELLIRSTSSAQPAIDALAARIDDAFSKAGVQANVQTAQHQMERNQNQFQIIYALFYSVTVIIALVGAIGLFNALAMSVLERRREIGILRSMGATGRKVAQVFWIEGLALGVIAWLIALALGLPAAYGFVLLLGQLFLPVPFAFDPVSLFVMLAFILLLATLASVGPVWGATRIKIAQTLRYE
jgi:putative ABC transport system permease protein